jgi:hypothetical protein
MSASTEEFEAVHIVPALGNSDHFHCSLISVAWKLDFDDAGRLQINKAGDFNCSKKPVHQSDVAAFIANKFLIHFPEDLQWTLIPSDGLAEPFRNSPKFTRSSN